MFETGFIGGALGYSLLRCLGRPPVVGENEEPRAYRVRNKLDVLLGPMFWDDVVGHSVLDFGCGTGAEAVEMARRGARSVAGLDIREEMVARARSLAETSGVSERCHFTTNAGDVEYVDTIISIDSFEHFSEPEAVLAAMASLVRPGGRIHIAFGPPWFHPLGGHLFSIFPWAHLLFSESALIRWRADFKNDGATRFREVSGGLNQMTVGRFRRIAKESGLEVVMLAALPIRRLHRLHNRLTEELLTSVVRAVLQRPRASDF